MSKKIVEIAHKNIKDRYPKANCFMYCLLLQNVISLKTTVLYDHDHCILKIVSSEGIFYFDQNGEFKNSTEKFYSLEVYGSEPVFSLFDSAIESIK